MKCAPSAISAPTCPLRNPEFGVRPSLMTRSSAWVRKKSILIPPRVLWERIAHDPFEEDALKLLCRSGLFRCERTRESVSISPLSGRSTHTLLRQQFLLQPPGPQVQGVLKHGRRRGTRGRLKFVDKPL